ncbi:GntP family permease [Endozoicomonas numazuensis]|uniref:Gluconate:proton symporter n=1 Tax=Endozoicomonas numazuensis TaxID=1137799 RepID=A0A081NGZ5_9GAMM|nr:SLC13 family permease [Endozoicomonas numazuensis]KEQ17718.1 gluconate:proton symporter [Endozoicomonas numazuensis]
MIQITTLGALSGLAISIALILRRVPPAYGMMIGALLGALIGLADLAESVTLMINGVKGITPSILRILAAGVLAGVLIESGGANVIAEKIVDAVGEARAVIALILATMLLTAAGVFVDVAVITVAPIALAIAGRANISVLAALVAMVGGGKAGNLISPNPNTIAAADAFNLPLTDVMMANLVPSLIGLIVTYVVAKSLVNKGPGVNPELLVDHTSDSRRPGLLAALTAPLVAIALLALRPVAGIAIDPMIALPLGGAAGALAMGRFKDINTFAIGGLQRMSGVAIMLIGTGTLAGIIANSGLSDSLVELLKASGLPAYLLAPFSGMMMSAATASTTAGTAVASNVFGPIILALGIPSLGAAAMMHSGATVLDHMPHGSFFHATGGSVGMNIRERLKAVPYETLIGFSMALTSTIIYGILKIA